MSMKPKADIEAMRNRLRSYLAEDREVTLAASLRRRFEDPLKPRNENGRFRANPILVLLAVLVTFGAGTFLFFSFVQP